jgi:four helix bundle protein
MADKIRDYRDLTVWQRAMELVVECYSAARRFPKCEVYALSLQLQRAAVSVPSNIAEGNGRASLGDYLRHLSIANGSLMELETHVRVAGRLNYLSDSEEDELLRRSREVGRMLGSLTTRLRARRNTR